MNTMATNVSRSESFRRYALGFGILAFFFANPAMPAWVTLVALYPLATAMVQWDPANALFEKLLNKGASQIGHAALGNAHKV
ncbi:MAG: hypothetical protein AMJ55_09985 [Gammaproteobacteria bacterium SG8_15]|nr:MAG: hypothetical protein AMJ55_09985 [Gammaproteobacteria bacterium SG8_15]